MNKIYLGDSVYAEYDGYAIILTTDNGEGPSNTIILEPSVYSSLTTWVRSLIDNEDYAAAWLARLNEMKKK